jgi:hypothetical protein
MRASLLRPAAALIALLAVGCDVQSGNDAVRNPGLNVAGFYQNGNGAVVSGKTGAPITSLTLRQNGDRLEAYDNLGAIFRGSVREAGENTGSFNLSGTSEAGIQSTLNGSITVAGTTASLRGTWIEPGRIAQIVGNAVANPLPAQETPTGTGGSGDTGGTGTGGTGSGDGTGGTGTGTGGTGTGSGGNGSGGIGFPPIPG